MSPEFGLFFIAVLIAYWALPHRGQVWLILLASWAFYAAWDWRFLSLIWISTVADFVAGRQIHEATRTGVRRGWLAFSLIVNLGILAYFKYANFFIESFVDLAGGTGWYVSAPTLQIILPVGISFYTFQTLSYSLDIYLRRLEPTSSFVDFAAFVAFFPQLVAGPIVRASEFLFQLREPRKLEPSMFQASAFRFLEGFFLKAVIADTLAIQVVDPVFAAPGDFGSAALWTAMFGYTVQIYADFAGYSSMAIGTAGMMGFRIPENFRLPYIAVSFSDFWTRWHITMSRFFRDYVYIPLGGSRRGPWRTRLNLAATTLISGLWHGASWTFVAWGGLHGLLIMASHMARDSVLTRLPLAKVGGWFVTLMGVMLAWVVFRAQSFADARTFYAGLWGAEGASITIDGLALFAIAAVVAQHLVGAVREWRPSVVRAPILLRAAFYVALVIIAFHGMPAEANPFIYFQF